MTLRHFHDDRHAEKGGRAIVNSTSSYNCDQIGRAAANILLVCRFQREADMRPLTKASLQVTNIREARLLKLVHSF